MHKELGNWPEQGFYYANDDKGYDQASQTHLVKMSEIPLHLPESPHLKYGCRRLEYVFGERKFQYPQLFIDGLEQYLNALKAVQDPHDPRKSTRLMSMTVLKSGMSRFDLTSFAFGIEQGIKGAVKDPRGIAIARESSTQANNLLPAHIVVPIVEKTGNILNSVIGIYTDLGLTYGKGFLVFRSEQEAIESMEKIILKYDQTVGKSLMSSNTQENSPSGDNNH